MSDPAERPRVLLTGATGYIGKHILRYLLKEGWQVAVIVRGDEAEPAQRIQDVLGPMGRYEMADIDAYRGDLLVPDCDLTAASIEALSGQDIQACIHCAGLAHSEAYLDRNVLRKNLQSTRHAIELCSTLGIKNFLHMSAAFVAGDSSEQFSHADLDVGQAFNNLYEESKYAEEHFLRERCAKQALNLRIYRPSVVVGGMPGYTSGQIGGIYAVLRSLHYLREKCAADLQRGHGKFIGQGVRDDSGSLVMPLRIAADATTHINLVSIYQVVNEVLADMNRILAKGIDGCSSKSLLGQDFSLQNLLTLFTASLRLSGTEFVHEREFEQRPRTAIEQFFRRTTTAFKPYLFSPQRFPEPEKNYVYHVDIKTIVQNYCGLLDKQSCRRLSAGR